MKKVTRLKASLVHLLLSGIALGIIFLLIKEIWYPGALFSLASGLHLLTLIIGVDLVIGPFITFIIYNPEKKYLKWDMSIVVLCQIVFMAYGCWTMFVARPAYFVFDHDRFYLVKANELDVASMARALPVFKKTPYWGPQYVGSIPPKDKVIHNKLILDSLYGVGIQNFPEYFVPYETVADHIIKAGQFAHDMTLIDAAKKRLDHYVKSHQAASLLFLPVVNKHNTMVLAIDPHTARIVDLI